MKSSWSKLRRFALHKNGGGKDKLDFLSTTHLDELAQAAQDMQEMRNCYDSLLLAAAATANGAYEFSESLQEMGSCLQEKRLLLDDEESRRILLTLGNLQYELRKLVDNYRSHILLTVTNPSESLLNEIRTVEDMKRHCDEKRNVYEYMVTQQKEKGRAKGGKGETFTLQQLQAARDEYDEVATLCVFRLKSLKQGQSRSLVTQAARHHAAQLNFFRKGLKSLEAIEPHLRQATEQQHIDYQFCSLEDDDDDGEDGEITYDPNKDGELSFDYRANEKGVDFASASRNSMEVDEVSPSFPQTSKMENAEVNSQKSHGDIQVSSREHRVGSHSAPIFPERKLDPAERVKQMLQSSTRRSSTYVLPTPNDSTLAVSSRTSTSISSTRPTNVAGHPQSLWHSSPLEQKNRENSGDGQPSEFTILNSESAVKENKSSNNTSTQLPPPLSEGPEYTQLEISSESKNIKRKAVSGPLAGKQLLTKSVSSTTNSIPSAELPHLASAVFSHLTIPRSLSPPKVSPCASPPLVSSPRLNELHELPRPPDSSAARSAKPPDSSAARSAKPPALVGHSASLFSRNQEPSASNIPPLAASGATRLPTPPLIVPRSFSMPSRNQRATVNPFSRLLEAPQVPDKDGEVALPSLLPLNQ